MAELSPLSPAAAAAVRAAGRAAATRPGRRRRRRGGGDGEGNGGGGGGGRSPQRRRLDVGRAVAPAGRAGDAGLERRAAASSSRVAAATAAAAASALSTSSSVGAPGVLRRRRRPRRRRPRRRRPSRWRRRRRPRQLDLVLVGAALGGALGGADAEGEAVGRRRRRLCLDGVELQHVADRASCVFRDVGVVDQPLEARHQPHPDDELAPVALVARVLQQRHREHQALDVGRRERRRERRARAPQLLLVFAASGSTTLEHRLASTKRRSAAPRRRRRGSPPARHRAALSRMRPSAAPAPYDTRTSSASPVTERRADGSALRRPSRGGWQVRRHLCATRGGLICKSNGFTAWPRRLHTWLAHLAGPRHETTAEFSLPTVLAQE